MAHVVMLLSNAFRPDPRVLKEAQSLAGFGYTVTILCWDRQAEYPSEERIHPSIQVVRIQSVRSSYGIGSKQILKLPAFWFQAQSMLKQLRPDILHCHDFDTLPAGLLYGKRRRIPVVYDAHEYYADLCRPRLHGVTGKLLYHLIKASEKIGSRYANAVVTVDEVLANVYRPLNPQVVVIGHYPPRKIAQRENPVFSRQTIKMVYIGRLSADRGLNYYLEVLRLLVERSIPARLQLLGVFTPENEKEKFLNRAGSLAGNIDLLGWIGFEEIPDILHQQDVGFAVLMPEPRYVAALPVKLFEYMAAGLPVIASDFPAIRAVVEEANAGQLVDPLGDPRTAAEKIQSWAENPGAAVRIGENGRNRILQTYNFETLAEKLDSLYSALLKKPEPPGS